jgi:hypothetical protein
MSTLVYVLFKHSDIHTYGPEHILRNTYLPSILPIECNRPPDLFNNSLRPKHRSLLLFEQETFRASAASQGWNDERL